MKYSFEEIDRLSSILEAEINGHPVDRDEAQRLAARLAEVCPDIALTMGRIADRMTPRH